MDEDGTRYNVAFSFDCPVHGTHRLTCRLDRPYDGFAPIQGPGVLVHLVDNGSFDTLTVESINGDDAINFGLCGKLRIIEGRVELVRVLAA